MSVSKNPQDCPLDRNYFCSDQCKWYDYENDDCRMLGMMWKIVEALNYDKREFKF